MKDITYKEADPGPALSEFVKSFWYVRNPTNKERRFSVLPNGFGGMTRRDLSDFASFVGKLKRVLGNMVPEEPVDPRKRELFRIVYMNNGAVKVGETADRVNWSSRQINRYFRNRFGISLKSYCNILRYRASFDQLKEKRLFPEQAYTDQSHFIRESKKYSGATPKQLADNEDDRFIQLSTLRKK